MYITADSFKFRKEFIYNKPRLQVKRCKARGLGPSQKYLSGRNNGSVQSSYLNRT